jgi:hypothetical protein
MAETSVADLERQWKERCESGTFSPGVLGKGTIRVMGRSGDAALMFPRIASLDALTELAPDEQYAVQAAQAIITQARQEQRVVFDVSPGGGQPAPVTTFRPDVESMVIVARVAGG